MKGCCWFAAVACCAVAAAAGAPSAELSSRALPAALVRARNRLPSFVAPSTSHPSEGHPISDSCPEEIWENLITSPAPHLPYRVCDSYDRRGNLKTRSEELPTVRYTSGSLEAIVYPTLGGKLASLKVRGSELLFNNPVMQPANLARLNAWTSGGIEWNWPRLGHTVFHFQDLFVGVVETPDRGSVLRLYEFDREMNSTFSVDLFSPEDTDALFARVRLHNTNPHADIQGYWWTNIGVNISKSTRVLYPADYAVVSTDERGLSAMPFPNFNPWNNGTWNSRDHSYPETYFKARENFIRGNGSFDRQSMGIVDGNGAGMIHFSDHNASGRKYWVWGNDRQDVNRMTFLSTPGNGYYLEMQAGVAPTQSQTFPLPAGETHTFLEVFAPISLDKSVAHGSDYNAAVGASHEAFDGRVPQSVVKDVNDFLTSIQDISPTRMLWRGSNWGGLHQDILAKNEQDSDAAPLFPGLTFDVDAKAHPESRAWIELVQSGTFSAETLAEASPVSWAVDDKWVRILRTSAMRYGTTWLHELHLAVCAHHRGNTKEALELYGKSFDLKPSVVAARGLALLNSSLPEALAWYNRSFALAVAEWRAAGSPTLVDTKADDEGTLLRNVASEFLEWIVIQWKGANKWSTVKELLQRMGSQVTRELLLEQAADIASISLLVYGDDSSLAQKKQVISRLQSSHYAVSSPLTSTLVTVWQEAWYGVDMASSVLEKRASRLAHPVPLNIDFRGAT